MNILPKKRWHVRTRENIARVRRDEAKAAEEEKQRLLRVEKAEREARTELLRQRARQNYRPDSVPEKRKKSPTIQQGNQHVNLFYELEQDYVTDKTNPEYEKEKKLEKEKYEKQIGYLTYLGQDTNEITGNVSWYNKDPGERLSILEEVAKDKKKSEDPLNDIRKYLGTDSDKKVATKKELDKEPNQCSVVEKKNKLEYNSICGYTHKEKKKSKKEKKSKKKKRKKRKHSSDSGSSDCEEIPAKKNNPTLESLRAERLRREAEERKRAEMVLRRIRGEPIKEEKVDPQIEQKYNSQFNPHLAKQNVYIK